MGKSHIVNLRGCGRTSHNIIYVNTVPMLLTEMTSRKSSENKSRSYRQCAGTPQEEPKLKCNGFKVRHGRYKEEIVLRRFQYG